MEMVRNFFYLLPQQVSDTARRDCLELTRFLSELAVCDYFFADKRPSHVALACILTAFEGQSHDVLPRQCRQQFVDQAWKIAQVNCTVAEVHDCRLQLREIYQRGQYHKPKADREGSGVFDDREGGRSPDTVGRRIPGVDSSTTAPSSANSSGNMMQQTCTVVEMSSGYVRDEPIDV